MKKCTRCRKFFPIKDFIKNNAILKTCNICREYIFLNREYKRQYNKEYREKNRDLIKLKKKKYYNSNIPQQLLVFARRRARNRNIEFNITKEDIINIFPKDNCCPIFKTKFVVGEGVHCSESATLDRIDNNKGYVKDNICVISYRANQIKTNATLDEIIRVKNSLNEPICSEIVENRKKSYSMWYDAKVRSKHIEFNITKKDIVFTKKCPLLGIDISYNNKKIADNSPSLDRIDNNKGYVKGNVWIVSLKANRIKNNATKEELEKVIYYYLNILNDN
jgi:hypothetical protein